VTTRLEFAVYVPKVLCSLKETKGVVFPQYHAKSFATLLSAIPTLVPVLAASQDLLSLRELALKINNVQLTAHLSLETAVIGAQELDATVMFLLGDAVTVRGSSLQHLPVDVFRNRHVISIAIQLLVTLALACVPDVFQNTA